MSRGLVVASFLFCAFLVLGAQAQDFSVVATDFAPGVVELSATNLTTGFEVSENVSATNVSLWWNNSLVETQSFVGNGAAVFSVTPSLTALNGSLVDAVFQYDLLMVDNSTYSENGSVMQQTLLWPEPVFTATQGAHALDATLNNESWVNASGHENAFVYFLDGFALSNNYNFTFENVAWSSADLPLTADFYDANCSSGVIESFGENGSEVTACYRAVAPVAVEATLDNDASIEVQVNVSVASEFLNPMAAVLLPSAINAYQMYFLCNGSWVNASDDAALTECSLTNSSFGLSIENDTATFSIPVFGDSQFKFVSVKPITPTPTPIPNPNNYGGSSYPISSGAPVVHAKPAPTVVPTVQPTIAPTITPTAAPRVLNDCELGCPSGYEPQGELADCQCVKRAVVAAPVVKKPVVAAPVNQDGDNTLAIAVVALLVCCGIVYFGVQSYWQHKKKGKIV